jgi:type IV secretory pathway TraG/TraD family ATPase VirD4
MSKDNTINEQELSAYFLLTLMLLWTVFSLGPLVLIMGGITATALYMLRANISIILLVTVFAALAGIILFRDLTMWLTSPVNLMYGLYSHASPGNLVHLLFEPHAFSNFTNAVTTQMLEWMKTPKLWCSFIPASVFYSAVFYGFVTFWFRNPLGNLKRQKQKSKSHGKVGGFSVKIINQSPAETSEGSLIGAARYNRSIELSDKMANQHTLVLGTTGSGKTVTVCNIVESAINRELPLIYIDGKGDYDLACRVERTAQQKGRPVSVFAMNGDSIAYNPLAVGGFTSRKDRIIELREWSEEHYKKLAEGYLQCVFKVMDACGISCNMATLAEHLDLKYLKALVREHQNNIPNAQKLMDELNNQDQASKSIESLVAEIRNFTASEIGELFEHEEGKPVLALDQVLKQNGIAYFCLPALEFPSMSKTLGRLVINDLKATMAQQLSQGNKNKVYVVFDEFSVFAGEQVLNVINMGRSAGIHAVLSTQSLSDIASGRAENADHFINQVVGNCNNFILHRQNSPEDAEKLAAMMGTQNTLEYTAQISQIGPTHMGTVRRTRGFIAHPDEIKSLQTGEAFFYSKENGKVVKMMARKSWI